MKSKLPQCHMTNSQSQSLSQHGGVDKIEIYNLKFPDICANSDEDDHVTQSKAPGVLLNGPCGEYKYSLQ